MNSTLQPDIITWTCAGLLAVPTVAVLVLSIMAVILAVNGDLDGPSVLLAIFGPFVCSPLLVAEYFAIARRSHKATSIIACLSLYFVAVGFIGWLGGLMDVLRLRAPGRNPMAPEDFAGYSAFLSNLIVVGLGHLRWLRLLRRAAPDFATPDG